ncbi:hypothetical protein [Streptomyces sp. F-1]|uniref:hypothetical protein n=1 Tax=Streptomyces sp. F-1 TaxID=463642 RepID=UPI00086F9CF3|nr:hypothetical protein [Streptomyces sp. F-1]SFY46913.1 hypothetical protein STEPF1_00117 [Streptomyces sp. F-1]
MKRMSTVMAVFVTLGLAGCGFPSAAEGAPASSSSTPATGEPGPRSTTDEIDSALNGSWAAFSPGSTLVLNVVGRRVELSGGGQRCEGTVAKEDGIPTIRLRCDDPRARRTVGKVWGLTEKTMTVDWEGYGADSFRHASGTVSGV